MLSPEEKDEIILQMHTKLGQMVSHRAANGGPWARQTKSALVIIESPCARNARQEVMPDKVHDEAIMSHVFEVTLKVRLLVEQSY